MKKYLLFISALFIITLSYGQVIKIQGGISMTRLKWIYKSLQMDMYPDVFPGYTAFVGLDFGEKKFYNFSANTGLIRKGGEKEVWLVNDFGDKLGKTKVKATLDYLTVNTTINLKFPLKSRFKPFLSIGPRFDYLVKYSYQFNKGMDSNLMKSYSYGLIVGIGLKYEYKKFMFGVQDDYYLNFNKIADWPVQANNVGGRITNYTFTSNLSIGYKLR
jgi:hypothetical protein